MSGTKWSFGDRVLNAARPEWGTGVVTKAVGTMHEGSPCQNLTIRFDRAGLKTISTAFANLVPAGGAPEPSAEDAASAPSPMPAKPSVEHLDNGAALKVMTCLPEAVRDPFATTRQRLEAILALYRFNSTGGSLLDWASAQSGMADPLTRFSRHELEEFFRRFCVIRDDHLRSLATDMIKSDPSGLAACVRSAAPEARRALNRVHASR